MSRISLVLSWIFMLSSLGACSSQTESSDPLPQAGGKADDTNADQPSGLVGTYGLDTDDFGGTLEIVSASAERIVFNLTVVGRFGGNPIGEVFEGVAEPTDGGQLVYSPYIGSDCDIYFVETSSSEMELAQVGACADAGFGANVDASGVYGREAQDSGLVGTYGLDTDDFGGTLEIVSASAERIEFNLTVVGRFGGNPIGEVFEGVAEPTDGGQLVYSPYIGSDCDIYFVETSSSEVELAQVGACADAGFGANVDASGVYGREAQDTGLVGTYGLDTDDFGGTLEIVSASAERIEFNLTVVGRFGGNPIGEVFEGVAEPTDGGQLVYSPYIGSDCDIYFVETSASEMELAQVGACADAGFGANVDASGVYGRE